MTTSAKAPGAGLEGVVAGDTAICSVDQGGLIYRGYEIHDLAENATFDVVVRRLLGGTLSPEAALARFRDELVSERGIPQPVLDYLHAAGPWLRNDTGHSTAVPMDALRTAVSILGNLDPESQEISHAANLRKAKRLTAKIPTIIGAMQRIIEGRDPIEPGVGGDASLSHAANLLYMMTGERPSGEAERTMDVSLILYAEHDYNASTFAGRIIAATLSDLHGAVTGAIAALKGPLHGGANEAAMEMLKEIKDYVDQGHTVQQFMDNAFATKRKLMGFGHRVYKNGDHRAPILHKLGRAAAEQKGPEWVRWFEIGEEVQKIMLEQKNIHPNVDFPCGLTYFTMGIPVPQYTPIFVASRVTGWAAHVMEQHANNRLIRPRARYTGPEVRNWNA